MIRVAISLTPEQYDWLSERPEGMAVTVRYFIEHAMSEERLAGGTLPLEHIHDRPWAMIKVLSAQGVGLANLLKKALDER